MKKTMVVRPDQMPDWLEKVAKLFKEIFQQLWRGLLEPGKGLTLEQVQMFVEHRNPFAKIVLKGVDQFAELKASWQIFYQECLGMKVDFSNFSIPKCPGPGWRLLIIAQGILPEQVFQAMKNFFRVWKYSDKSLNDLVVRNERDPKDSSYAIWVRDVREADEVHKNKSANRVKDENLSTETLSERLVHEFKYFRETGKHLDVNNVTLCSGSRFTDGHVPSVHWHRFSDGLDVYWYHPDVAVGVLRSRETVS